MSSNTPPSNPEFASPEDVDRVWALMTMKGVPRTEPHRVHFWIACPNRATGAFLIQYLRHSAEFAPTTLRPAVSHDGKEYWEVEVSSYEGALSLHFLRQVCSIVHIATKRFGGQIFAWGKAQDSDLQAGGLTSA